MLSVFALDLVAR